MLKVSKSTLALALIFLSALSIGCANTGIPGTAAGIGGGGIIGAATANPFFGVIGGIAIGSVTEYASQKERNRWRNFFIYPCPLNTGPHPDKEHNTFAIVDYKEQKWLWGWERWWLPEKKWREIYTKPSD